MKKVLISFFVTAMAASLVTCKKEPEAGKLESITFKEATYTVQENYNDLNLRKQLVGTPAGVIETCKIEWTVSDPSIAEMNSSFVEPKMPGEVDITATAQDKKATCRVLITEVPVESAKLEDLSVALNGTAKLHVETVPSGISISRFDLTSLDNNVATVDPDGTVHGVKEGSTTIKAVAKVGDATAECTVTVKKVVVTKIEIPSEHRFYEPEETYHLTAKVYPEDASSPEISWASSNSSIVKVDQDGNLTAVKYDDGTATNITATADGFTATCKVRVSPQQSTSITLDRTSYKFNNEGETFTLKITDIQPTQRTLTDNFKWTTSNKDIAVVNNTTSVEGNIQSVTVKCVGAGNATITCEDTWSKVKATCTVERPVVPVTSITLNKNYIILYGESAQETLTATLSPYNTTTKTVTWSSDNTGVATVTSDGVVKVGYSCGEAYITAKADGKTAQCRVVVYISSTIQDSKGNLYSVIKVDGDWWMNEDLRCPCGTLNELGLTNQAGYTTRASSGTGVNSYYYNRKAAQSACPTGYRLPTEKEWNNLTKYVHGDVSKWQALKSTTGWETSGLNQLFFNAKPAGWIRVGSQDPSTSTKEYVEDGTRVSYWGKTGLYEITNTSARFSTWTPETHAFSVRCIKE